MSLSRVAHGALAILAALGLVLEYLWALSQHPDRPLIQSAHYVSFFTIQTNTLILLASICMVTGHGRLHRWASAAGTRAALTVYILVVALVFQALLAGHQKFDAVGWWGNLLAHQLVPGLWIVGWLWFGPHGDVDRAGPWRWLIYPLGYCGWTMAMGSITGWYPYFFLNPDRVGWGVAGYVVGIAALFLALGFGFRWIDGRLALRVAIP
ncbi:Pr6Pr family membrane protein [Sphingomonas montanisoli]|uniref:Pr6Pr family membrane protein n=1 Tax=Sphingomonas montanisoli TaxID=2606412 RepID=A0A5D9C8I9_9SPHN|nr:Pr6Pr family membrane protein [Sphingomonas montanisoli]TZG26345.1 hypothetical protein FYJ91_15530 [Sphingomonas montanisoli]